MIYRKAMLLALAWLVVSAGLPASAGSAEEKVNYRLKWRFNTSVVGDVYADAHGYFEKEGIDVTVKPGGPERDAIRELELGYAQFGVASADQVIRALSKGARVRVLAQLFQVNPLQWIYRSAQPPITTLADLKGRVIGITFGGNDETIMKTILAKAGIPEGAVTLFSVRYDFTPFYRGKTDLWPVYRNSQGPILSRKLQAGGEAVSFFNPADFGVNFVANSVVTSEKMMAEQPDQVARFIRALLAAWRDALAPQNAEKALSTLAKYDPETPRDIQGEQLRITRGLVREDDGSVGRIDVAAWEQTEAIMMEQKLISAPVSVADALTLGK